MKWLTIPQIKRRSKTAKGALKVSHEHWCQLYDATAKELRAEYENTGGVFVDADYCGLCTYKKNSEGLYCEHCIFGDYCPSNNGIYEQAAVRIDKWYRKDKGSWHAWKRACKAVRDKLKELMNKT